MLLGIIPFLIALSTPPSSSIFSFVIPAFTANSSILSLNSSVDTPAPFIYTVNFLKLEENAVCKNAFLESAILPITSPKTSDTPVNTSVASLKSPTISSKL